MYLKKLLFGPKPTTYINVDRSNKIGKFTKKLDEEIGLKKYKYIS